MLGEARRETQADVDRRTHLERDLSVAELGNQLAVLEAAHSVADPYRVQCPQRSPDACGPLGLAGVRYARKARFPRHREGTLEERQELSTQIERNATRVRLLTPLAKYLATETCDELTRNAIQVHGGLGFMAESVPGKLHADGIITTVDTLIT